MHAQHTRMHAGVTAAVVELHSCASRTGCGVHALGNAAHLRIVTDFGAGSAAPPDMAEEVWLASVRAVLPRHMAVLRRFDAPKGNGDLGQVADGSRATRHVPRATRDE